MSITITLGKSGRLVVPKAIRDSLGLREGSRLKLDVQGGKIHAAPEADLIKIEMKNQFPVIQGSPSLNPVDIVRAIKADRDERDERALSPARRNLK